MAAQPARVVQVHPQTADREEVHHEVHPQAQACMRCGVRHLSFFGALPPEALQTIQIHIDAQRLKRGAALYFEGQAGEFVYTLRSGLVRLERSTAIGARRVVRLFGRGDVAGLEAMLGRAYSGSATALGDVEICRIPTSLVRGLALQHPELTQDLMERWQQALDDADEWLSELSVGSARYRALRLLQKLLRYFDDGIVALPGRGDMGAMLNLTVETSSRLISEFRRDGLLEGDGPRWFKVDIPRLEAAVLHELSSS